MKGPAPMERPYLGKLLAIAVIVVFFAWTAIRALGARPAETPSASVFPKPTTDAPLANSPALQSTVFAGGCFWGSTTLSTKKKRGGGLPRRSLWGLLKKPP